MIMNVLTMSIEDKKNDRYVINISSKTENTKIIFSPVTKVLEFLEENELALFLKKNEYQLRKILHNKRKNTYYKRFELVFVLRDRKDVEAFNDRSKIVVLDKRKTNNSYVIDEGIEPIDKLYIDGSYLEKQNKGGVAILHKDIYGKYHLYVEKITNKTSNLTEMIAAIRGVEILNDIDKLRIITDSQYVRKGLTEWIFNWKLNDWKTANGEKVNNIEWWQKFDNITQNKYIEFEWVKGHSNHFENTICDLYAKEAAKD